ncbi:MAG: VWA domain-containing protein [Deltaproteobacteria bacterium]|nr:VWA domain-containing protein [Deltaproteobacteria bacterium]
MTLATPWAFLALLALPVALFLRRRHRAAWAFANQPALAVVGGGLRARLAGLPVFLMSLGYVALVVALARPQTEDWEELSGEGLDIMVCLDMSGSMNAVDLPDTALAALQAGGREPHNRFEVARASLRDFIRKRHGDRVGLVIFAADAFLKFPLTLDYAAALEQLDGLTLDSGERDQVTGRPGCLNRCTIEGSRTAIGDALSRAWKRLEDGEGAGKVIILITDGNDNASKLPPMDVARRIGALEDEVRPRVYAFLIGSGENTKIPALAPNGRVARDHAGRTIYADDPGHVDEARIRELVEAAGGVFHVSYDEDGFRRQFEDLERRSRLEERVSFRKEEFLPFLLAGLGLLALGLLLEATWLRRFP